jgi:phosphoribosylaminoimidazolecarboxamide formyltransferase/IMP cyclohydrolase
MTIKTALISVYDKDGLEDFAVALRTLGIKIIASSGTAKYLENYGVEVKKTEEITGFSQMMGGRVKTLNPLIYGGILARREITGDMNDVKNFNIPLIDMVVVNLYPFFEKLQEGISEDELIEFIDIGGPSMIRASAKNFKDVVVITDKNDYFTIIEEIRKSGNVSMKTRKKLASKAFALTSAYDSAIHTYFSEENNFGDYFSLPLKKVKDLRYGENPHQKAALYKNIVRTGATISFEKLSGKELSYNNYRDADIAWKVVSEFDREIVCCGLKHNSPCGVAVGQTVSESYEKMLSCDPISIFGGIIAFNNKVDVETAKKMKKLFFEILIAPDYEEEALKILAKKKKLVILKGIMKPQDNLELISIDGGLLVQERDVEMIEKWKVVTDRSIDAELKEELEFAYKVVKYVKSNSIVVSKNKMAVGVGAGQVNRIWAATQALERGKGAKVLASDAFFPFDDVVKEAGKHGIRAIIQPGGSIRDKDSIEACNKLGIAMVFTGTRHFKH